MGNTLLEERRGRVAILTLNRPESLNALDTALMRRLLEVVRSVAEDSSVRCVVLTGAGAGFCAGGDVKAVSKAADDRVNEKAPVSSTTEARVRWLRRSMEVSRLLHEMPKPTIAMINGACAGAGMSLAAACDLRFAATSAKFRLAFTANGLSGDYGGTWLWSRILGAAKARRLYLIDERRDAASALEFGLIDDIFADDQLEARVLAMAEQLAELPATGVAYAKDNLNAAQNESFSQSLDREALNMMLARNALVEASKAKARALAQPQSAS